MAGEKSFKMLLIISLLLGALGLWGAVARSGSSDNYDDGRYRIYTGNYINKSGKNITGVFKIDSHTGKTWLFVPPGGGSVRNGKWQYILNSSSGGSSKGRGCDGRYRIYSGDFTNNANEKVSAVFRVDTHTGKAWLFVPPGSKSARNGSWQNILE